MKVLIVGNYKELSGWSTQLKNHILALDSVGVDVVPRNITITQNVDPNVPQRILELEERSSKNPDVVVLNTLPAFYERQGGAKYFGFYVAETSSFKPAGWQHKINLMDRAIVPNFFCQETSRRSEVKVPIHIVPQALDIHKFDVKYPVHPIRQANPNDFIFYTIGELTRRKNVEAILRAFHTEFSPNEPVQLFVKTTPTGLGDNPQQLINELVNKVKGGLKLYNSVDRYKKEFIIPSYASDEEINSIHQSCNCYVTASHGEAFNIPLAEAMAAGKIVVAPNHSGMDYVTEKNAFVPRSYAATCFGAVDTISDLYTGREWWHDVDVDSLRKCMRDAFEKRDLSRKKIEVAKKDIQKFSYQTVGKIYKETLQK
jgi:glycosyltransferase involved in cell wall biosynthesis